MGVGVGTRIGSYEIVAALGAGGMGEVYRARDTRLDRDVAIKLLPEAFAHDHERLARFEREAKTLAALNHPNIAAIYGIEEAAAEAAMAPGVGRAMRALILELVEGPTLADRVAHGPIALDEALPIARQIAEALEAAHEKGVIHRDLKPANVKLRTDGTVKVLDFGLAKLAQAPGPGPQASELTASPTITTPAMTGIGVILGTAAYMSPEQARGKVVDKRADVWAFGCVLYEMLTGRRVFGGEDVTDTIAAVVRAEPDWSTLPADTPASIRRLLRRCLEKDVRERLPEIGSARLEISDAQTQPTETAIRATAPPTSASLSSRRERLAWSSVVLLLAVAVMTLGAPYWRQSPAVAEPEMRVEISTPRTNTGAVPSFASANLGSFALSPDGRHLVFSATGEDGQARLWLRPLDVLGARELAGTEGALFPFWSPDSRSIAFFADRRLKRLDVAGGPVQTITEAPLGGRGGTWNSEGIILFAVFDPGGNGLLRVPASGGDAVLITKPRERETHRFPQFLPDGRHFLYFARFLAEREQREEGIYLASLDSGETRRLASSDTAALYTRDGWALFVREGRLIGQRLDLSRQELTGDPVTVAEDVYYDATTLNVGAFSVSASGAVAYRTGGISRRQLTWFDRSGTAGESVGAADGTFGSVALSPDGRRVATHRSVQQNVDLWIIDGARTMRFTFDSGIDESPVWSADGQQIVFDSTRSGVRDLYRKASAGGNSEELLTDLPKTSKWPVDVSADGRSLLFETDDPKPGTDIWVLSLDGDRKPFPFVNTAFDEQAAQFSPDGRWVTYSSNESGRTEIYVRPFPGPGGQWQISTAGGSQARWAPSGKEVYYIAPDATLMAVPIVIKGDAIEPGAPVELFQTRIWNTNFSRGGFQYDVGPDGRFLINVAVDQDSLLPITLLLNWNPEREN